jgi:hypothetical protein
MEGTDGTCSVAIPTNTNFYLKNTVADSRPNDQIWYKKNLDAGWGPFTYCY